MRSADRSVQQIRPVKITRHFISYAEGSVLIELGDTRVLCTASVKAGIPRFIRGRGHGWITAEYGMIPHATYIRSPREAVKGKQNGRTMEIQRIIARSLRTVVDLTKLGEYTIILDCDVIQADGGTRTVSITGACVALADAISSMQKKGQLRTNPMKGLVAAISVGIVAGQAICDLEYAEDLIAETDMNIVMMEDGRIIEIQGTAEGEPFNQQELNVLLEMARSGINSLIQEQKAVLLRT